MPEEPKVQHTFLTVPLLGAGVIIAVTVLAYLPSLGNGFIWDDDRYVTENPTLRSWPGLAAIWTRPAATPQYYPLVFTTFWIEHSLWAAHALSYHLVNILLHATSAVMVWRLLRRLGAPGAFWAGLVFAVHPVQVESVAWITERKNVLSGLLYLLSAAAYLAFDPPGGGRRRWGFYALAVVLFIGALLSKTVTCTLPAALLLVLWWKRPRLSLRDLWPLAPLLGVGTAMGLATAWLERVHVGAEGQEWALSPFQRVLVAGQALWFYASKLLWPKSLAFIYPHWPMEQVAAWQYLFPLSAAAVMVALVLGRHRIGKGPAVAVLFFAGTLFPALGFLNVYPMRYSFVADHFQYLASIGLIALVCAAMGRLGGRLERAGRRAVVVGAIAVVTGLAMLTWRQSRVYHSEESVWRDTLTKNSDCWMAHNNLGVVLASRGQAAEAVEHYQQALRSKPDYAEAHSNLGNALASRGQLDQAIEQYHEAMNSDPHYAPAYYNLGLALASSGRLDEAIRQYRRALESKPDFAAAHYNLGVALASRGQLGEAIEHYRQALESRPDFAEAHNNLGIALTSQGRIAEAIQQYREALKSGPDSAEAHNNLALALASQGQLDEAIEHYCQALKSRPDFAEAHDNLGTALASRGQVDEAIEHFRQALDSKPDYAEARYNLGVALASRGQLDEAIEQYRQALRSKPDLAQAHNNLGTALMSRGQLDEAIQQYREALKAKPDYPEARENLSKALAQARAGHPATRSAPTRPTRP